MSDRKIIVGPKRSGKSSMYKQAIIDHIDLMMLPTINDPIPKEGANVARI